MVAVALSKVFFAEIPTTLVAGPGGGLIAAHVAIANQFVSGAWRSR
jgi:hypothetical protein